MIAVYLFGDQLDIEFIISRLEFARLRFFRRERSRLKYTPYKEARALYRRRVVLPAPSAVALHKTGRTRSIVPLYGRLKLSNS
jgi:hypothetical protein